MTDSEFIDAFESGSLPPAEFRHRDHLRLTWVYLQRHGRDEAERRLMTGLRAFAIRAGKPGKFDGPLTMAWVEVIDRARAGCATFDEMIVRRPELLDPVMMRAGVSAPRAPKA
jgi:hypothetical protein